MAKLNNKLRSTTSGIAHWCPGCQAVHVIPNSWQFNNDISNPSFSPSVKINFVKGEEEKGNIQEMQCHYFLTNNELQFCGDCTHELKGKTVPLPDMPTVLNEWDQIYVD